ncbi:MAG: cation:dicarboxylase symporter family transporter [Spirochaetales bacterium]|nr:cation:dicarboxylase symporter family transporter [Spirochaetales bacterium]MBQ3697133.1 cation:dicarboxylase symporter family transporter [Spirochaetales bacterium]
MKTWLTYLAAAAMGLAFELTLHGSGFYLSFITFMADVMLKLGIFMVFPLAFFTMTSGTASLTRKRGNNSYVWLSTILWATFTTAVLSIAAGLLFRVFPAVLPTTSTSTANAQQASELSSAIIGSTVTRLAAANPLSVNSFLNFIKSSDCLLPIILIALIFGYAIRPTSEVIRPAYITLNSISEVMFRLAKIIARFLWIGIFFISGVWFHNLWTDATVFYSWRFVVLCCIIGFGMLFVIIPLVYGIMTGFRRNPYRQIVRLLSSGVAAFFSVNYLFSMNTLYTDCRINLGIQKSVVSSALPLHSILTKGGSALVSSMCTCSIVFAATGVTPTALQTVTIALACTLASFICSIHAGYEVLFITTYALGLLNINAGGAQFAIIALLPMLNGMALLLDVMLAGLGTSFTASNLNADCYITAEDIV